MMAVMMPKVIKNKYSKCKFFKNYIQYFPWLLLCCFYRFLFTFAVFKLKEITRK